MHFRNWIPALLGLAGWLVAGASTPAMGAAADASRWEPEIRAFEAADRAQNYGRVDAMFYGSSSFRLWSGLESAFPGLRVLNRGFGGCQLSDLNAYFDRVVVPRDPRVLLIYGGDNDLAGGKDAATVERDFKELVGRVKARLPGTRVIFVTVKPSPAREKLLAAQQEANTRVRRWARWVRKVEVADLASPLLDAAGRPDPQYFVEDRLHLNEAGYAIWRERLAPLLQ